ncbi:MAG: murein L,D-transpeptidase catalytic domain family protein [Pseudomonadota bacterium]
MRLSRRGLILGGSALLAGCSTAAAQTARVAQGAPLVPQQVVVAQTAPSAQSITAELNSTRPLVAPAQIRTELVQRAMAAMDLHDKRITRRDRMYLVDFSKHSSEERFYEVDLEGGHVSQMRTAHGRGSDPAHSGYARSFSNTPESYMSSVGAFATAGAGMGAQQGPNVLLDGLEYSNDRARERAIIVHGADYADPDFLAREGKLGRSYGCFSVAHGDLPHLRERMGDGRLLFAFA